MVYFTPTQKLKLARSLFTKAGPVYVQYYVTARCNMECEQCNIIYADGDAREMGIEQIHRVAENFAKIDVGTVLLIGGEPFVRSDLPDIVEVFVRNGIHVRLQTNGFASEEMLRRCVDAGGHDISVSLDTLDGVLQNTINGGHPHSWEVALKAVALINNIFPENSTAFFGTVIMPRNIEHIPDVVEFATAIGWWVSLVPVHVTTPDNPLGFRTFDDGERCRFKKEDYPCIKMMLRQLKTMRRQGMHLYDSDEYLDDIYRFIAQEPLRWRQRNNNVCDSPSLYFSLEPNGNVRPCCDYKLDTPFPAFDNNFVDLFNRRCIHKEAYRFTRNCSGCMYGSYPEITITARYLIPFIRRCLFFNMRTHKLLKKMSYEEIREVATSIFIKNKKQRRVLLNSKRTE